MDFVGTFQQAWQLLLSGLGITVLAAVVSIIIGMVLGLVSCLMGLSGNIVLRAISKAYVWVIRGTPMLVQAMIVYFALPMVVQLVIKGFSFSALTAGIVTLSLNAGAYLSEIFRGGIQAVDGGQVEAARSLGLSSGRTMWRIVLPQAVRIAIPSMVNQFIITVKDTSILSVIGLPEIVNRAGQYVGTTYQYFSTYMIVAVFYLVVISILMVISRKVEDRLKSSAGQRGKGKKARPVVLPDGITQMEIEDLGANR